MSLTWKPRAWGIPVLVFAVAVGLLARPIGGVDAGQTSQDADGVRLLKGAIDMHFHVDPLTPTGGSSEHADIAGVRVAHSRGLRGVVVKHHAEPTASLAYLLRLEVPNFDVFGAIVLNHTNGGINPTAVEFMATQIKGAPGRVVWMPAGDSEIEVRQSRTPDRPFVRVSRNGELLPEVKTVISVIAKRGLTLASGHIAPEEALMVFREARRQGVQHLIATHAMDLAGKMTLEQMQEAAKLGAIIEFDFRNTLSENGRRADAIRKIGPAHCLISEFWTKGQPGEYGAPAGAGAFAAAMRARGFTDRELDTMLKDNPARLLGLSDQ